MQPIKNLIGKSESVRRASERGEFIEHFYNKANNERAKEGYQALPIRFYAVKLAHLKETKDLYYLKSITDDAERRGESWGRVFWGSLKTKQDLPDV